MPTRPSFPVLLFVLALLLAGLWLYAPAEKLSLYGGMIEEGDLRSGVELYSDEYWEMVGGVAGNGAVVVAVAGGGKVTVPQAASAAKASTASIARGVARAASVGARGAKDATSGRSPDGNATEG